MTNKQKTEKLRQWLKERDEIKISVLEKNAGLPSTTIAQIFNDREIPEHHWPALEKFLGKKYCWKKT